MHTRFQKGQSGNLRGRPKGSKNFETLVKKELDERVIVTESGRRKQITKREVIAKQVVNKAASDPKALRLLLEKGLMGIEEACMAERAEHLSQQPIDVNPLERLKEIVRVAIECGVITIEELTAPKSDGPPSDS